MPWTGYVYHTASRKGIVTLTGTTSWIRLLTDGVDTDLPKGRELDGSRCPTSQALFMEWAVGLGFPDYFGHNWDAFRDCLGDAVSSTGREAPDQYSPPPLAIILREAGDILADEPHALAILLAILDELAGDDKAAPRLLLLLDDTPDPLSRLAQRLADAGYPPASPQARH